MSFLRHWFDGRSPAPPRAAQAGRRFLPAVEHLEKRLALSTLIDHGGPVLRHVQVEAVFVGSAWQTDPTLSQEMGNLQGFLGDITNSTYMDQLTHAGYHVGRGSLVGSVIEPLSLPGGLDERAIHGILRSAIADGSLPPRDANRLYFIFVEPGVEVSYAGDNSETGSLLGYHSDTRGPGRAPLSFAVIPYDSGVAQQSLPNLSPFEAATQVASHELAESVTDPFGYHVGRLAWYDTTKKNGGEIADLTGGFFYDLDNYVVAAVVNRREQLIVADGAVADPRALAD